MIKLIQVIIFALVSVTGFAQAEKESVEKSFFDYFETVKNKDIDGTLDFMYPKIFEMAPRALLKSSMEGMYKDDSMGIEFLNNELKNISFIPYKKEDEQFARVAYSFDMKMTIFSLAENEEAEDSKANDAIEEPLEEPKKEVAQEISEGLGEETTEETEDSTEDLEDDGEAFDEFAFIHAMYNEQFGHENVSADEESGSFTIHRDTELLAINQNDSGWKFLELKMDMMPLLKNILPKEIIKSIQEE